jgi:hypothetical protein
MILSPERWPLTAERQPVEIMEMVSVAARQLNN